MIVISGINKKLTRWLPKKIKKSDKKILFYEYANNVDELMEVATLIITKPGGMTTSEALAKGLPMVIVNPIPGQEMRNTDFLLKEGIGIRIDKASDIGEEVELLIKSPQRLAVMSKAAYANGNPCAAMDIATLILKGPNSNPGDDSTFTRLPSFAQRGDWNAMPLTGSRELFPGEE